jgi:hypothetical protein
MLLVVLWLLLLVVLLVFLWVLALLQVVLGWVLL